MSIKKMILIFFLLLLLGGVGFGIHLYLLFTKEYKFPVYPESDHYNSKEQVFVSIYTPKPSSLEVANTAASSTPSATTIFNAISRMLFEQSKYRPKSELPQLTPDWQDFTNDSTEHKFIWLGHSTLMMRVGGKTLITDPVFGSAASPIPFFARRFQDPAVNVEQLPEIDYVLLSHNHYDHLEKSTVTKLAKRFPNLQFITPLGVEVYLQDWGIAPSRIQTLDWWQSTNLNQIKISATPSVHNTARGTKDRNKSLWVGYIIEQGDKRYFFSGDNAFGSGAHYQKIAERFPNIDIAFVENGQYNVRWINSHMLPQQTVQAIEILSPRKFVPIHWGAYPLALHKWNEPVKYSIPAVQNLGIGTITPLLGQVFTENTITNDWYSDIE